MPPRKFLSPIVVKADRMRAWIVLGAGRRSVYRLPERPLLCVYFSATDTLSSRLL